MPDYPSARDCEHGQLRRACPICEAERRLVELQEAVRKHLKADEKWCQSIGESEEAQMESIDNLSEARAAVDALVGEG